ncbi:unnamed protein product [Haemonchus placei]|uniref:USP domain-containing protein n=1 Tax=Haemonchus placei TaxID=6290 RepID=A0A3P7VJ02_HAEPC|nr:unnamed protein product [Haemonchus placei]
MSVVPVYSMGHSPPPPYSLFAIVTHIGDSSGAGHYISYVRRNQNKWYRCDDHQVFRSRPSYLLFYQLTQLRLK